MSNLSPMEEQSRGQTFGQKLWTWFRTGHYGLGRTIIYLPAKRRRIWGAPLRILRVLKSRRTIDAAPALYVAVGGVGILAGIATQKRTGVRWWIAPATLLGGTWAYFTTSPWWHPVDEREPLGLDLLSAVTPDHAARANHNAHRERLIASTLPLLSPDEHGAIPTLSSTSDDGEVQTQLTVRYPNSIMVGVYLPNTDETEIQGEIRSALISLRSTALRTTGQVSSEHSNHLDQALTETRDLQWAETTMDIDGIKHPARVATAAGHAATYAQTGQFWALVIAPASSPIPHLRSLPETARLDLASRTFAV